MDIFLSINNREKVITIPILPSEFTLYSPQNNERYQALAGELNLIAKTKGLKAISFSSYFPSTISSFSKNNTMFGWDYVKELEKLRDRRLPFRLIITETIINIPVLIDNFEPGMKSNSRNVYYTIEMSEFRFPVVK